MGLYSVFAHTRTTEKGEYIYSRIALNVHVYQYVHLLFQAVIKSPLYFHMLRQSSCVLVALQCSVSLPVVKPD